MKAIKVVKTKVGERKILKVFPQSILAGTVSASLTDNGGFTLPNHNQKMKKAKLTTPRLKNASRQPNLAMRRTSIGTDTAFPMVFPKFKMDKANPLDSGLNHLLK